MMESRRQQQQMPPWPGGSGGGGGGGGGGSGGVPTRSNSGGSSNGSAHSRFVEGSMNDRVSAAPPPDFLGPNEVAAYERQFYYPPAVAVTQEGGRARERASFQHYPPKSNREFYQRRPTSSSGPSPQPSSQPSQQQPAHPQPQPQPQKSQPQLQKRRSKFLTPLWDGVREKLNLSRSKSSSSIGRVFSKEDKGVAPPAPASTTEPAGETPGRASITVTPGDTTGYPTREEVMESYKSLVASGFFQAHAIQGTRHPPRHGSKNPGAGPAIPSHTSQGPPVSLKSFSEHLASANAQNQKPPVPGFPSTDPNDATKHSGVDIPFRAPPPPQTRPPPPPVSMRPPSIPYQDDGMPSPSRGTKRGMPIDAGENESSVTGGGTRKLVKKLRRSTSRASVDVNLGKSNSHTMSKPRPSTSSAVAPSIYFGTGTPRPSVSSNTGAPSAFTSTSTASALANANNPFYVSPDALSPSRIGAGMRTPPPKRKNKLTKLASATKESAGRRIIGTLGFGGLRRTPSTSAKQPPFQPAPQAPEQAPPSLPQPTITTPAPAPASAPAPAGLLPPAIIDIYDARKSFGDTDTGDEADNYDSDAMVIDSPPPVVRQAAVARAMVAPAPSAFHYPQRQRATRPQTASATVVPGSTLTVSPLQISSPDHPNRGPTRPDDYHHHHHEGHTTNKNPIKPLKRKPFPSSFVTTTALSPPPANRTGGDMSTTPPPMVTKISVMAVPMSPAKGNNGHSQQNIRDSGLGHGYSHSFGSEFGCAGAVTMMRDARDDEDMENCPPPSVPGGPAGAATAGAGSRSGYVW